MRGDPLTVQTLSGPALESLAAADRLFAVVDACGAPAVPATAAELGTDRARSLFPDGPAAASSAIAPHLLRIDAPALAWLLDPGTAPLRYVLAVADASLDDVSSHCRRLLHATAPGSPPAVLRFFDPAVLGALLRHATPAELPALFGPIEAWIAPDPSGDAVRYDSPTSPETGPDPSRPLEGALRLRRGLATNLGPAAWLPAEPAGPGEPLALDVREPVVGSEVTELPPVIDAGAAGASARARRVARALEVSFGLNVAAVASAPDGAGTGAPAAASRLGHGRCRLGAAETAAAGPPGPLRLELILRPAGSTAFRLHAGAALRRQREALYNLVLPRDRYRTVVERWAVGHPGRGARFGHADDAPLLGVNCYLGADARRRPA